jgi:hypothetical protein
MIGAIRVARASGVPPIASRDRELSLGIFNALQFGLLEENRFGGTPKPTRETRALPIP